MTTHSCCPEGGCRTESANIRPSQHPQHHLLKQQKNMFCMLFVFCIYCFWLVQKHAKLEFDSFLTIFNGLGILVQRVQACSLTTFPAHDVSFLSSCPLPATEKPNFVRFKAHNENSHPLPNRTSSIHPGQDGSAPAVDQRLLLPWHVPGSLSDPGQCLTLPGL